MHLAETNMKSKRMKVEILKKMFEMLSDVSVFMLSKGRGHLLSLIQVCRMLHPLSPLDCRIEI